jgi:OOP family OmpA-OmpF porin
VGEILNTKLLGILFTAAILTSVYGQGSNNKKYHPLSGKIGLTLEGGATYTRSDFKYTEFSYFGRFLTEYFFPSTQPGVWGLRAHIIAGFLESSGGATSSRPDLTRFKTTFVSLGGGGEYLLSVSKSVIPYIYGGAAYLYFDPRDREGNRLERNSNKEYSRHEWMLIGELGCRFPASPNLSFNVGLNVNYVNSDNLDDVVAGSDNDIFFTGFAGLSFYFGGTSDSDGDGIKDEDDLCPGTPKGIIVDQFGCPVDNDNDGVPDHLDKCPNTPANIPVDLDGCPIDSDGDGVPDYLDLCRDTPQGVPVDKRGCPFDEDNDGVPDYRDKCPGTPIGTEVDKWGCPLEILEKKLPEATKLILSGGVNFEVGKSRLLNEAQNELDKLAEVMLKYPETRWKIEGHTDITGSYSNNKRLSYERALSVANYLNSRGISRSRMELNGFGPDQPIADNRTESGRLMNRRVEINLIRDEAREKPEPELRADYNLRNERHAGNMIFTDGNLYCVQVASFRMRSRAEREMQRLRNMSENAYIVEANLPQLDGIWYRVRIGYFRTLNEARLVREKVVR